MMDHRGYRASSYTVGSGRLCLFFQPMRFDEVKSSELLQIVDQLMGKEMISSILNAEMLHLSSSNLTFLEDLSINKMFCMVKQALC